MMAPLHCQATAAMLLLVLPAVSALVPWLSIRQIRSARRNNVRKMEGATVARDCSTRLSLMVDPTDMAQHAHVLHQHATMAAHDPASIIDQLSSLTLAKASSIVPNQSLAPLSETVQSGPVPSPEVIPDMIAMPGGAPRSGNAFVAESLRDAYSGTLRADPQYSWNNGAGGASIVIPARELDVVGRYADLLNRIPLAATVYALVDFFLINAEEDIAIVELLDEDEEVEAIMEVESGVMMMRFVGLMSVVAVTVAWSLLTYHPVPFSEL